MTINNLLIRLLQNTQNDTIEWTSPSSGVYRFLSNSGAVTISKHSSTVYFIRLYDLDSCFAEYDTVKNSDLLIPAGNLYDAIVASINRAIERKIGDVFTDLS